MITEKEFKERCAEILRKEITFSHQVGDYVIHGALDSLWKLHTEQNSHKHGVMQAEGSDGAYEAAVASEWQGEANMSADAGCPRCKSSDLLDTDDHWTHCQNCGFSFVG